MPRNARLTRRAFLRLLGTASSFMTIPGLPSAVRAATPLDEYGGLKVAVGPPGKLFSRAKVNGRWVLVTPHGHAFWMLGVFNVGPTGSIDDLKDSQANRILKKYGNKQIWADQTTKRLKSWGFNTLAEYATAHVLPVEKRARLQSKMVKMPFVTLLRPSWYGLRNQWNFAPGPFKNLLNGIGAWVDVWRRASVPDVFDPNFEAYVGGWMGKLHREIIGSPWLMGFATDDADNLFGFGPSAELPAARLHPHIGWLALVGNSEQADNTAHKVTYSDRKVYTKLALRDFLRDRYKTLAALNTAWGSTYTSWESDGGWPGGRGVLDESGRSAWVGGDHAARKATPAAQRDLDEFLYRFAKHYFSVMGDRIRKHAPGHLVFGPATLNGWNGLTHRSILRAAGEHLDVLQASVRSPEQVELTVKYAGDLPIVTWTGMVANDDSALWRYPYKPDVTPGLPTQEARAERYGRTIMRDFNITTRSGAKPVVGTKFWSWTDHWGEKRNWGLVSFLDNAYDGKEAVRDTGSDPWGFPTGGEERDYGDFISGASRAHDTLLTELLKELQRAPRS